MSDSFETPVIVAGGALTALGRKMVQHLRAVYEQTKDGLENMPGGSRRNYLAIVHKTRQMTALEYLTAYPDSWSELWLSYISSLDADDPIRAQSEQGYPQTTTESIERKLQTAIARQITLIESLDRAMNPLDHTTAPPLATSVERLGKLQENLPMSQGSGQYARLTAHGENVVMLLSTYLTEASPDQLQPYMDTIRAYVAYTRPQPQGSRFMTPGEFFATFPTRAAELHTLAYDLLAETARGIESEVKQVKHSTPSTRIVRL